MLLHCALFPTPYADASTNFDVLRIQQLMLNTHCKCLVSTTSVFMSSSRHVDQYSVINCSTGRTFSHIYNVEFKNIEIQVWRSCIVQCYKQCIYVCYDMYKRGSVTNSIAVILLAIMKAACVQLEVTLGDCNIFQVNFKMAIAHCCQAIHRLGLQRNTATLEWLEEKDFPEINTTK
jgi:hypothetical protein